LTVIIIRCREKSSNLEAVSDKDAHVSWYSVTELDLNDVADDQFLRVNVELLAVTYDDRKLPHRTHTHIRQSVNLAQCMA